MRPFVRLLQVFGAVWLAQAEPAFVPSPYAPSPFAQTYTPPAFADSDRRARLERVLPELDRIYLEHATNKHLPGFVYGVVLDGELVHTLAWGQAQLQPDRPVTTATRFRIASMSKSFTALAILKLRDAGRLSLEDPVEKFIPQFRKVKPLTRDSPKVTVRHLLKMTAGFPQDDPWGDRRLADTVAELEHLVAAGLSYSNPTGIRWEYSNLGYALLGQVVTRAARRPYQHYITRELLRPLGMTNTVWEFDQVPAERLAHGYRWENDRWNPEPMLHDGTFGAMGGLITTVDDFARYVAFHLDAWPPRDDAESGPVRRATLREMHRPAEVLSVITDTPPADGKPNPRVAAYSNGLSWNTDARGATWVRHAGGLPGFGSEYRFLPEHGVALISFANLTYAPMTAVNGQAMEVLLEQAKLRPRVPVPSPSLQTRAVQLTMILQQWPAQLVADAFAPNVFQDKSEADWRAQVDELLRQAGRIRSVTPLAPDNQLRGRFSLLGDHGRIEVFFTLMPEAVPKIQDLRLSFVANPAEPRP
jgi:CubicO group peptidase (beta-lactamase class C family)